MSWKPLEESTLSEIKNIFRNTFPAEEYGGLSERIGTYWTEMLRMVWEEKPEAVKLKDLACDPADPLSRVEQKTVLIAYADSIRKEGEKSLEALDSFLLKFFPAVRGMHMLPACEVVEERFNDGYFSQVRRDRIHPAFGSNEYFEELMGRHFSMTDFVLNHVDIQNPLFQAYLEGDDSAGEAFFVFSEEEYRQRLQAGDFSQVFRPRPFPLFSIYRRKPKEELFRSMPQTLRFEEMVRRIVEKTGADVEIPVVCILYLFNKIQNDQMLLDEDFEYIKRFRSYLEEKNIDPDTVFTLSVTQEVRHPPYIFRPTISRRADLLAGSGFLPDEATRISAAFDSEEEEIFGDEIRALTTFSHVQADLNTSTFRGLKMLADDFSWYLKIDMNMLRLDAANFAFKRWGTSCFGLPEVKNLMKILYLSMEAVSPRIIANLEVNNTLTAVLTQMADKDAPPPMMYDFHLPCIIPAVFLRRDPSILGRIFRKIDEFDIPMSSIRFSLAESHDGKSVRGSMDLLTISERQALADMTERNGGRIKYKSVPLRQYPLDELSAFCGETGLDQKQVRDTLFEKETAGSYLFLKKELLSAENLFTAIPELRGGGETEMAVKFFLAKLFDGREPYELCIATRNSLDRLEDIDLEIRRYLSFHTLAFALMGRNVKAVYVNDLLGLPNDLRRFEKSGELRDLKRTKSDYDDAAKKLSDEKSFEARAARHINNLIALVDSDPALNYRGREARVISVSAAAAAVLNRCGDASTLTVVNLSPDRLDCDVTVGPAVGKGLIDNFSKKRAGVTPDGKVTVSLEPFQSVWLSAEEIRVEAELLV